MKRLLQEKMSEGVTSNGLTLAGFLFLYASFIAKRSYKKNLDDLKICDYDINLKPKDDLIAKHLKEFLIK